jgi:hypothetical protein
MKWATWEKVGIDRMGCAWLITKFIDPQAEFSFVPVGQTKVPEDCEPFDIPGVRLSHRRGHCTFHTILKEYRLDDPILLRIARIVDEVDEVPEVLVEPVAPGLDLICRGIRLTSPTDAIALERGNLIFEALYTQLTFSDH